MNWLHTKLDSLGAEYGRLGSVAFVCWEKSVSRRSKLKELPAETRNVVRLLGGAALPAHFPPYVGTRLYRELTNKRIAAILRNSRRAGLSRTGIGMKAGQTVSTGTLTGVLRPKPGETYVADFGPFGSVTATYA